MNNQENNTTKNGWNTANIAKIFTLVSALTFSVSLTGALEYVGADPGNDVPFGTFMGATVVSMATAVAGSKLAPVFSDKAKEITQTNKTNATKLYKKTEANYVQTFIQNYNPNNEISMTDMGKLICLKEDQLNKLPEDARHKVDYVTQPIHRLKDIENLLKDPPPQIAYTVGPIAFTEDNRKKNFTPSKGTINPNNISYDNSFGEDCVEKILGRPTGVIAGLGVIAALPVTGPGFLVCNAIKDNFFTDYPEIEVPKTPVLRSNTAAIKKAFDYFHKTPVIS